MKQISLHSFLKKTVITKGIFIISLETIMVASHHFPSMEGLIAKLQNILFDIIWRKLFFLFENQN